MIKLEQYDTNQSLDNDIEDLIKIDSGNKHFNTLIINVVQKYSLGYIQNDNLINYSLKEISGLIKDEVKKIELRKNFLKLRCNNYEPYEDFMGPRNGNIRSEIKDLYRFLYSCDCLFGIASTSEIFKEIVLLTLKNKENTRLLELGSGSGILSLAGAISAKRAGNMNIMGFGLEQGNKNIVHSDKIINQLELTKDKIFFINKDIVLPCSYDYLDYFDGIDLVVVEIFSKNIPSFKYDGFNNGLISDERCVGEFNLKNEESRYVDPLFEGLNVLNKRFNIFEKIEKKETVLWPDVTKDHLKIKNNSSNLYLNHLGKNINLSKIGDTFKEFENISSFNTSRWE